MTALALRFERARREVLGHCVRGALKCGSVLSSTTTSETDPCLARVATKCQTKVDALATRITRLAGTLSGCVERGLSVETIVDSSGLAFEYLSALCPEVAPEPRQLSECQAHVLACNGDHQLAIGMPRASELLERMGLLLDDSTCIGNTPCGNDEIDDGEECDDGADNSDTVPDACRSNCQDAHCGDGVIDSDEDCDDANTTAGDGCESDCTITPGLSCGDGIVDGDEECDDGPDNSTTTPDACRLNCLDASCGDGVVDSDEDCDDDNTRDGDGCESDCTLTEGAVCGDSVVDDPEECDDGSGNSGILPDACRADCTDPGCGDNVVDPGNDETCEPPGTLACDENCSLRFGAQTRAAVDGRAEKAPVSTDELSRCQARILAGTQGLYKNTTDLESRCVAKVLRCTYGIPEDSDPEGDIADRCLERANALCLKAAQKHDAVLARMVAKATATCTTGNPPAPIPLATLLDESAGLGFQSAAAACEVANGANVDAGTLYTCVARATVCSAEGAVSRSIPSAADLLFQLELDAATVFPCITDLQGD